MGADERGTLTHSDQTVAPWRGRGRWRTGDVLHVQNRRIGTAQKADPHGRVGGMLARVGQRLLRRPQHRLADLRREQPDVVGLQGGQGVLVDEGLQPFAQVDGLGAQRVHGTAGLGQPLDGEPVRAFDLLDGVVRGAVAAQHQLRALQLHRERRQRMRQDVVHVAGDAGTFGEGGRAGVLLGGPGLRGERHLALLGTPAGTALRRPDQENADQRQPDDAE
ncbi:MAG: hypothetical protein ABT15_11615 [Pseudonocardia sp. SCN 73-27]|nr:MAG: hypothetical protein ABT15_11615 [Pseudonocardia sp. SCN 73-27]